MKNKLSHKRTAYPFWTAIVSRESKEFARTKNETHSLSGLFIANRFA
jgi:hypothetical protein